MYELCKNLGGWLTSGAQWSGSDGIAHRLAEHLQYSLLATLIAAAIGLPLGLLIGHTGRGAFLAINLASFGRALPTVGLVVLVFLAAWPVDAAGVRRPGRPRGPVHRHQHPPSA